MNLERQTIDKRYIDLSKEMGLTLSSMTRLALYEFYLKHKKETE